MSDEESEDDDLGRSTHSTEHRLGLLERDARSHARSLTEIIGTMRTFADDLKLLREWQMNRLVAEAREEERDKALYRRLDELSAAIKSMRDRDGRVLWIIGTALLLAFVAFVVRGGIAPLG